MQCERAARQAASSTPSSATPHEHLTHAIAYQVRTTRRLSSFRHIAPALPQRQSCGTSRAGNIFCHHRRFGVSINFVLCGKGVGLKLSIATGGLHFERFAYQISRIVLPQRRRPILFWMRVFVRCGRQGQSETILPRQSPRKFEGYPATELWTQRS